MKLVIPPITFPNMIPTNGTSTTSLKRIFWTNHTKIQVPRIAATNANTALPRSVDSGRNTRASKIPSWAEEIVAPVVGDTHLCIQSCCMISPAVLIPIPVHRIARSRGILEIRNNRITSGSPCISDARSASITPINREQTETTNNTAANMIVDTYFLIPPPPLVFIYSY